MFGDDDDGACMCGRCDCVVVAIVLGLVRLDDYVYRVGRLGVLFIACRCGRLCVL